MRSRNRRRATASATRSISMMSTPMPSTMVYRLLVVLVVVRALGWRAHRPRDDGGDAVDQVVDLALIRPLGHDADEALCAAGADQDPAAVAELGFGGSDRLPELRLDAPTATSPHGDVHQELRILLNLVGQLAERPAGEFDQAGDLEEIGRAS